RGRRCCAIVRVEWVLAYRNTCIACEYFLRGAVVESGGGHRRRTPVLAAARSTTRGALDVVPGGEAAIRGIVYHMQQTMRRNDRVAGCAVSRAPVELIARRHVENSVMMCHVVERLARQLWKKRARKSNRAEPQCGRRLPHRALQLRAHESPVELSVVRDEDVAGQCHHELRYDLLEARRCRDHALADAGEVRNEWRDQAIRIHQALEYLGDAPLRYDDNRDLRYAMAVRRTAAGRFDVHNRVRQPAQVHRAADCAAHRVAHQTSSRSMGHDMQRGPPPPRTSSLPSMVITARSSSSMRS